MAKKIISTLLVALMCIALLCACTPSQDTTTTTANPQPSASQSTDPQPTDPPKEEVKEIKISDYLGKDVWEDDGGDVSIKDDHILFDNAFMGDFAALRLTEKAQNVTYKFSIQLSDIPTDLSEEAGTWWDSELIIVGRSAVAGNSYQSGDQKGYCLTAWGDLGKVYIGRAGYDDAFGSVEWNVNDGQPHDIEFTLTNNEDNTQVTIVLKVDGQVIFEGVDDGSKVKQERPALYPDEGGFTIRCKYFKAIVK